MYLFYTLKQANVRETKEKWKCSVSCSVNASCRVHFYKDSDESLTHSSHNVDGEVLRDSLLYSPKWKNEGYEEARTVSNIELSACWEPVAGCLRENKTFGEHRKRE